MSRISLDEIEILKIEWTNDIPQKDTFKNVPMFYTVRPGDTLFSISAKFGISVDVIMKLNGLKSDVIKHGMRLRLR